MAFPDEKRVVVCDETLTFALLTLMAEIDLHTSQNFVGALQNTFLQGHLIEVFVG